MFRSIRKFGAVLALLVTGCAGGRSAIPLNESTSLPDKDVYYVTTTMGEQLDFVTLESDGAVISGTVREVRERLVGQGDDERVESRSQYRDVRMPLSDVARIEVDKPGSKPLVLIAAGAAAIGGAFLIFSNGGDDATTGGGGGGKGPPDLP
ncbi:MAG TPA: hypothetical protein VF720_02475 [Candidatus Eisenbacteria bacterium]